MMPKSKAVKKKKKRRGDDGLLKGHRKQSEKNFQWTKLEQLEK